MQGRRHRRVAPALLAMFGLGLLTLGLVAQEGWIAAVDNVLADRLLTSAGAISLAAAHLLNWRLRHRRAEPIGAIVPSD